MSKKQSIFPDKDISTGPYSPTLVVGNLVYVSGQGPLDPDSGRIVGETIEDQAKATLDNVRRLLEAAGATMNDCVKVTVYLSNIADYDRCNSVYVQYFDTPYPARTLVQAILWNNIKIEIDAIAIKGAGI